jgi:hypothetical protein
LLSAAKTLTSMHWKQSCLYWFREGKCKSKKKNSIISLNVNGARIDDVTNIRAAIYNHFRVGNIIRPGVEDLNFKMIYRDI